MSQNTEEKEVFVQVGFTALRDPYGKPLPSVPLYRKVKASEIRKSGLTKDQEQQLTDISGFFIEKCTERLEMTPQGLREKAKATEPAAAAEVANG